MENKRLTAQVKADRRLREQHASLLAKSKAAREQAAAQAARATALEEELTQLTAKVVGSPCLTMRSEANPLVMIICDWLHLHPCHHRPVSGLQYLPQATFRRCCLQVRHEQSKNSFSKEQRRVWQDKCALRSSAFCLTPCPGIERGLTSANAHRRLAAKEAMLTRLGATLAALHEQHTALTQASKPQC